MKWTKELPKEEGWYWYKEIHKDPEWRKPRVLHVSWNIDHDELLFTDGRSPRNLSNWPGEWAGPIPLPVSRRTR